MEYKRGHKWGTKRVIAPPLSSGWVGQATVLVVRNGTAHYSLECNYYLAIISGADSLMSTLSKSHSDYETRMIDDKVQMTAILGDEAINTTWQNCAAKNEPSCAMIGELLIANLVSVN